MIERTTIRFEHDLLRDLEHPAFEARGRADGPHLALIAGVHGCEYSSIAAVTEVMRELDTDGLAGSITAVPVVSMQSYVRRSPFVVPEDGKNLNRAFPGSDEGGYTDALARSIFDTLIAPADALLDLHGGDMVEALEPFSIYGVSPVAAEADALARAFGLRYVVRQEGGLDGMTATAAAEAGIPAIIAEAGGCGLLGREAVDLLATGVRNALKHLGMLPGEPEPPAAPQRRVGRFDWLRCARAGWWAPSVAVGAEVAAGDLLGEIRDLWGDPHEEIRAPADGVVLFLTTSPAVADDGLLLGLGAAIEPLGRA